MIVRTVGNPYKEQLIIHLWVVKLITKMFGTRVFIKDVIYSKSLQM